MEQPQPESSLSLDKGRYRLDVSALLNLAVPQECLAGIEANMELMQFHARKVEAFAIPNPFSEPKFSSEVVDECHE